MTKEQTAKLLTLMGTVFPKLTEGMPQEVEQRVNVWHLLLTDVDYKLAETATVKMLRSNRFQPVPADIIEAVRAIENTDIPTAEEAWREVHRKLNPYKWPEWSHPLIEDAVRVMGWMQLCTSESPSRDREQFFKIYNNLRSRNRDQLESYAVCAITQTDIRQLANGK